MKIIYVAIAWAVAIILIMIGFHLGRKSAGKTSISYSVQIPDKDMEMLKKIITQICNYAVENNLPPTYTLETTAKNILYICNIADFDDWHKEGAEEE